MNKIIDSAGTGFAIITAIVLVAVIIYTIIKLRQQVRSAENTEKKKSSGNLPNNKTESEIKD